MANTFKLKTKGGIDTSLTTALLTERISESAGDGGVAMAIALG